MKTRNLAAIGILLLGSASAISAQGSLPIEQNDACWQSLAALRACELAQEKRALEYVKRCTSYPEYQCMPAAGQDNPETGKKRSKKYRAVRAGNQNTSASDSRAQQ